MAIPNTLSTNPYDLLNPDDRWRPGKAELANMPAGHLLPPLVGEVRRAVKKWRDDGYPDVGDTTRALLAWWFDRDGEDDALLRYYFSQREAVETVIYLFEAAAVRDKYDLLRFSAGGVTPEMITEAWRRYVIKMATGSGKTKVMSLLIAWSYFHKLYEENSQLSRNVLLIAPNIIVLDRLYRDFEGLRIFHDDGVLPPNGHEGRDWQSDFQMHLHRQNEVRFHTDTGNLFLTNIHRVYVRDQTPPSTDDEDTRDYFLGPRPTGALTDDRIDLGEVVRELDELLVINDEAHHIHDKELAWFKAIEDLHNALVQKDRMLSLQVDMTATPKHNNGAIFVQTVADYPLVEAVHQNIVKRPVIPDDESCAKMKERPSADYCERYADYIELGVKEWRKVYETHKRAGKKAVLFVMTDDTRNCDELGKYLQAQYHDLKGKVLVIHTKKNGEITEKAATGKAEKELMELRKQAAEIDGWDNPYRAVVSVLVLREGWDVRNVATVVGLRAYSAKSNILPEQTLGRGLRLMYPGQNDTGEKVSVIGSPAFIDFVGEIEKEGVKLEKAEMGAGTPPQASMVIAIDRDNPAKNIPDLEIAVPVLSRRFSMDFSRITQLSAEKIPCAPQRYKQYPANAPREVVFRDFLSGEISHTTRLGDGLVSDYSRIIGFFTSQVMGESHLFSEYHFLYGVMQDFVRDHLFGKTIDLEAADTVRNLAEPGTGKAIRDGFSKAMAALFIQDALQPQIQSELKVTDMRPFAMKPAKHVYAPKKCAQNLVVGDSSLETRLAGFLDKCPDVAAFAKNYLAVNFRLDYVKADGKIANYFPDFLVRNDSGEVWIVETKGRKDEDDIRKWERLQQWCGDVGKLKQDPVVRPLLVEEAVFRQHRPGNFADLVAVFDQ